MIKLVHWLKYIIKIYFTIYLCLFYGCFFSYAKFLRSQSSQYFSVGLPDSISLQKKKEKLGIYILSILWKFGPGIDGIG